MSTRRPTAWPRRRIAGPSHRKSRSRIDSPGRSSLAIAPSSFTRRLLSGSASVGAGSRRHARRFAQSCQARRGRSCSVRPDAPMSRIDEHLACTSVWRSPRQFPSPRPAEQPPKHSSSVFGRWPKCWRSADPPSTTSSMPTSSLRFESARVSGFLSSSSQHHVLGRPRA